ncbi:hypothetical protein JCM10213_006291 [Rhodosporidiobolus nylandii]
MTEAAPMNTGYTVSVLTTHTVDSHPSLLVTFDNQRYLFNAPEAFSRVALQNKVGLRKVGHVFLGELEQSGGLPGFVLSSVEAGNDKIKVFGPEGTDHLLASCRFFTRRDKLSLKVTSPPSPASPDSSALSSLPTPIHADPNLIVHAFTLSPGVEHAAEEPMAVDAPAPAPAAATEPTAEQDGSPSLKRKRSSTSPSPPPRAKSPPGEPSQPGFAPSSSSFTPSRLTGDEAAAWRNLVLRDMFRGEAFEPRPPPHQPPSPGGRRGHTPAYLPASLPPMRDSTPSTLSYLVIGPRKRGKFLPEKAKALGVQPGKAFSKLIAGQRVWVSARTAEKAQEQAKAPPKKETKKERAERVKREREIEEQDQAAEGEGEGRWVEADECLEAGQDATAFLVLNVPSPAHLPSLLSSIPASLLQPSSLPPQTVFRAVYLFLGPSVLSAPLCTQYLSALTSAFPAGQVAFHVSSSDFIAQGKNEVVFGPSSLLNLRLSQLDSAMFHLPRYSFLPSPPTLPSVPASLQLLQQNSHFSSTLTPLPPSKSPFGSMPRSFDFAVPSAEADLEAARLKGTEKTQETLDRAAAAWAEYVAKAADAKKAVEAEAAEQARKYEEGLWKAEGGLQVTPLGTGSAIPSKYRNVSSTLLHLPQQEGREREYILLDAGEGTWGQISRRFGDGEKEKGEPSKEDVLRGIKLLFISHLHQDHHAGLSTLLRVRAQLNPPPQDPLFIVCPPNARTYLFEQQQLFDLGLYERHSGREVRFIDNPLLEPGKTLVEGSKADNTLNDLKTLLGLTEVTCVPVLHRCRAWGVVVSHTSGWKIVFSGDTTPCDALVAAGQGASLLVHEATIEDDMPEVAEAKGHSTFGQAIDVATRMQARHLLLTHFSARYPKLPPLSSFVSSTSSHRPVIATAFDLMTLPLSAFWRVERYRDAMDALLSWDEADEAVGEDGDELSGKEKTLGAGTAGEEGEGAKGKKGGKGREDGKMSKRQEKKLQKAKEAEAKKVEGESEGKMEAE